MPPDPIFIPQKELRPGVEYPGYVARAKGLVRKDAASFTGWADDGTTTDVRGVGVYNGDGSARAKDIVQTVNEWGVEPNRRRTPQERLASLASRIVYHYQKYGWSESLLDDLVALSWVGGVPQSREDIKVLARNRLRPDGKPLNTDDIAAFATAKLMESERVVVETNRSNVVNPSPYVLSRPEVPEREKRSRRRIFASRLNPRARNHGALVPSARKG